MTTTTETRAELVHRYADAAADAGAKALKARYAAAAIGVTRVDRICAARDAAQLAALAANAAADAMTAAANPPYTAALLAAAATACADASAAGNTAMDAAYAARNAAPDDDPLDSE